MTYSCTNEANWRWSEYEHRRRQPVKPVPMTDEIKRARLIVERVKLERELLTVGVRP